jgi:acetyl-CoA carboxylase carboxyl transferase subunit beta
MSLFSKPKYSTVTIKKRDIPKDLWTKCPISGELIYNKHLEQNLMVAPNSGYHFPIEASKRIDALVDNNSFIAYDEDMASLDPLNFKGIATYTSKIKEYQQKTGLKDAVISGMATIDALSFSLAVMDFRFLGASMGSVVGEKITRTIERGIEKKVPVVIISSSGGARMYEGILSLMQMAKTSGALALLKEARIPYISVLTNPTMAGVMASFASLGDIILAEPGALIGFAGPRVIKETTQQDLPEGFQSAEFLLDRGLIDQIVPRHEMPKRISSLLKMLYYK